MKNFLLATFTLAAFSVMPAYAGPPAPIYSWTGLYLGGQVGGGWASNTITFLTGSVAFPTGTVFNSQKPSGALGGLYAGYNYQIENLVVGIDGDYSWASLTGDSTTVGLLGLSINQTTKFKSLATLTGRLGYAMNNWMVFGKAGGAWARNEGGNSVYNAAGNNVQNGINSTNRNGWTIGSGLEWGFAANWVVKLEYTYFL